MSDEADYADSVVENNTSRAIFNIQQKLNTGRESAHFCEDCDNEIPQARRLAVKGCTRCAACQGKFEYQQKTQFGR